MDRTYWRAPGRSWHALEWAKTLDISGGERVVGAGGACGRYGVLVDTADRVPPNGHLCGNCARIIAARSDIEGVPV